MSDRRRPASLLTRFDEVEVEIEKLVAGGDGLARHEGLPVFVGRAAPGDRARVRVTERRPSYARAEIVRLIEPGAGRREPPCRHFGRCGGCDLQHLDDDLQVDLKVAATLETLRRLGGVAVPEPTVVRGAPWAYRSRAQLHVERAGEAEEPGEGAGRSRAGYYARGSHDIVEVTECPVLVPHLETAVRRLATTLEGDPPPRIDLCAGDDGSLTSAPVVEGLPHGEVRTAVGEFVYAFDARCFFQGHCELLPRLVDTVVGDGEGSLAVDLYAGVGLFSLPLTRRYDSVIAVEGDRVAARYARINARRHGLSDLRTVHQAVESWMESCPGDCDRVVVDPPRAGLARSVVRQLLERGPRRLTYVSCHPAALARDLSALDPLFAVETLTLLDLFPQTGHIEAVVQLSRRRDSKV